MFFPSFCFFLPPINLHLVSKHWAASANLSHWLFLLWPAFQVLLPQSLESMLLNISITKLLYSNPVCFMLLAFSLPLSSNEIRKNQLIGCSEVQPKHSVCTSTSKSL